MILFARFATVALALLVLSRMSDFARLVTGNISPSQACAIQVLARNGTFDEAARAGDVNVSTIYRWRQDPEFQTALALAVEAEQKRIEAQEEADSNLRRELATESLEAAHKLARTDPDGKGFAKLVTSRIVPKNLEIFDKMLDRAHRSRRVSRRMPTGDGPGVVVNNQASASATAQAAALAAAQASASIPFSPDMRGFVERDLAGVAVPLANLFPRIEWILTQADRPDVHCIILCLGKGSGKAVVATLGLPRFLQRALAHPDPAAAYGLLPKEKIGVINLSVTEDQAGMAIFDKLQRAVMGAPWFQQLAPEKLADRLNFSGKNAVMISGSSSAAAAEGITILAAMADEVDRLPETEKRGVSRAKELVSSAEDTMLTRFPKHRKLIIASWPEHRKSYIVQRIEEARKAGIVEDLTTALRACPIVRDNADADARRKAAILEPPFCDFPTEAFLAADGTLVVQAPTWEMSPLADLEELGKMARNDPFGFARKMGARPMRAGLNPFIPDVEAVRRGANPARKHPVTLGPEAEGGIRFVESFRGSDEFLYYAHLDLSETGDAAGLAVGHFAGGKVVYDLLLEMRPQEWPDGKLVFSRVRGVLSVLRGLGFEFASTTTDGWEGHSTVQDFEERGFRHSAIYSVDRDPRPYQVWKGALLKGQLDYYDSEPFYECCESLFDTDRKIDHDSDGKKDLTDAAAAVACQIWDKYGNRRSFLGEIM